MTPLNEFKSFDKIELISSVKETDTEFSIPLCINDIISICKDFNSLGWSIQNQIENILEAGVEEALKSGHVKLQSLPYIKFFLQRIINNPYFGDAASQAQDCLKLIFQYEEKHKINYTSQYN